MKKKILSLLSFLMVQLNSINFSLASGVSKASLSDYQELLDAINYYGKLMTIFIVVFALASFVYNIIIVATSMGNSARRSAAITNIIVAGGVAAGVPFASIIVHFLMNL